MMSTGRFNPFQCDFAKLEVRPKIEIMYADKNFPVYLALSVVLAIPILRIYMCVIVESPKNFVLICPNTISKNYII